jgi:hypothetical protein
MKHRYLFTLEVTPLELGKTYAELPSHLTLMSRFFSELSPDQLGESARSLFEQAKPINLIFNETAELGPKRLTVHLVENSAELKAVHDQLLMLLRSLDVELEYPQFVGDKHKPHITARKGTGFDKSDTLTVNHAYLIEVVDSKRVVRSRFELSANSKAT